MGKLEGKVAIVTGASRGIGRATAMMLVSEGASVVFASRTLDEGECVEQDPELQRDLEGSLSKTVEDIRKSGSTAIAVKTDLSSERSCFWLVEKTKRAFGPVDVLVNDAVIAYYYPINEPVGIIEIRNNNHIPLFFLKPQFQKKGLGKQLLHYAIEVCSQNNTDLQKLTVHATPNAVQAYEKMGFIPENTEQCINGIKFVPMGLKIERK